MLRMLALLATLGFVLVPVPGHAVFHIASIDEVASGTGGDANAQYVAIKMLLSSNGAVGHSQLVAFNCNGTSHAVLLEVPGDVCPATAGGRWTMGTTEWATATGNTPDFIFPANAAFSRTCGMICWGAPGGIAPPPNPPTWDTGVLTNYVDCVGYGGYTGPLQPGDAAASALAAGDDATMSLHRNTDAGSDAVDFGLAARTATHNGICATTTTTSTTSTTIAPAPPSKCSAKEFAAAGKKAGAKAKCHSQAIGKGDASKLAACLTAAETKFATAYGKAAKPADCLTAETAPNVETTVDNFISSLHSTLVGASTGPSKCTSKELAAAGKLAGAEAKCYSKATGKGDQSAVPGCVSTAKTKFEGSYAKAMAPADCINATTAATVEGLVDGLAASLKGQLAP
jgi:hypothetical protein